MEDENEVIVDQHGKRSYNPYNSINVEITLHDVHTLLTRYGLPPIVNNMSLYKRAFVHRSYTKKPQHENLSKQIVLNAPPSDCNIALSTKSNERLEFLGDGVLELIAKLYLYKRFPKGNEGFMTEKKIAIVKNESIGKIAHEMGLHRFLIISRHAEEKNIRTNFKKLGCLFEAFLGALFLDLNKSANNGFQMAQKFIEAVFETHIDFTELLQNDDNYKNILQVKIQREFKVTPHYIESPSCVPGSGYTMGVYLAVNYDIHQRKLEAAIPIRSFAKMHEYISEHGYIFCFLGKGEHQIKRKAEQIACKMALDYF